MRKILKIVHCRCEWEIRPWGKELTMYANKKILWDLEMISNKRIAELGKTYQTIMKQHANLIKASNQMKTVIQQLL